MKLVLKNGREKVRGAANRRNVIIFDAVAKSKSSHSEDDPARTKDTELLVTVPVVVIHHMIDHGSDERSEEM